MWKRMALALRAMNAGNAILQTKRADCFGIGGIVFLPAHFNDRDFGLGEVQVLEIGIEVRFVETAAQSDDSDGLAMSAGVVGKLIGLCDRTWIRQVLVGVLNRGSRRTRIVGSHAESHHRLNYILKIGRNLYGAVMGTIHTVVFVVQMDEVYLEGLRQIGQPPMQNEAASGVADLLDFKHILTGKGSHHRQVFFGRSVELGKLLAAEILAGVRQLQSHALNVLAHIVVRSARAQHEDHSGTFVGVNRESYHLPVREVVNLRYRNITCRVHSNTYGFLIFQSR